MNRGTIRLIEKALQYADEGTPMKDAFDTGVQEQEVILQAFQYVLKHTSTNNKARAFSSD